MGWFMQLRYIAIIICSLTPGTILAGDWMLSKGRSKLGTSLSVTGSNRYWDEDSKIQKDICTNVDGSLGLRYEHGYSYHKTLFFSTAVKTKRCADEKVSGISSMKMGVRGRINPFRNGHTWEASLIIPVQADRFEDVKSDADAYGLELGLFRTYRPDPYKFAFTEQNAGVFGWATGINLWSKDIGHQFWLQGSWRKKLNDENSVKATLGGKTLISGTADNKDKNGDRLSNDYDVITASFRLSHKLDADSRVGISLRQDVWGRNTSRDTAGQISYQISWD